MIKPAVGRNLYYQPGPGEEFEITQHPARADEAMAQPLHAHILYVHDDRHVTLEVVDHIGNRHVRGDVMLYQDGEPVDRGSEYCYWMPYQNDQKRQVAAQPVTAVSYGAGSAGSNGAQAGSSAVAAGVGGSGSISRDEMTGEQLRGAYEAANSPPPCTESGDINTGT